MRQKKRLALSAVAKVAAKKYGITEKEAIRLLTATARQPDYSDLYRGERGDSDASTEG